MDYDIIIIGFGISGIAMAKQCQQHKRSYIVLDQNKELGGCWWDSAYETAHLNSPFMAYSFSDMKPLHEDYSYPNRDHILQYLQNYCDKWKIYDNVKFNTSVLKCSRQKNKWQIKTKLNGGGYLTYYSNYLCVCTGFYHSPRKTLLLSQNKFSGGIYTASDFSYQTNKSPTIFKNKKVIIIGNGPSGVDISILALKYGAASVTVLYRSDKWFLKRDLDYSTVINRLFISTIVLLIKFSKTLFLGVLKLLFKLYYFILGIHRHFNTNNKNIISRDTLVVTDIFLDKVTNEEIQYIQSEVVDYYSNGVITTDNKKHFANIIVDSTGYKSNLSFIGLQKMPYLYNHIIHPNIENCGFIGFAPSYDWLSVSEAQSYWYINYILGKVNKPSKKEMYHRIVNYYTHQRQNILDYHELSYHSFFYIDTLLKECNHPSTSKNIKYWLLFPIYNYSISN